MRNPNLPGLEYVPSSISDARSHSLIRGGLTAVEGIVAYGTSAVAPLFSWEGGKTIHVGPKTINLPEAIGRRFISSIFYDPTGLTIDFIMEKFYE